MKHKLRFILPRLIGATVIIGLASMVLFILFKLLIAAAAIGIILAIASKFMGKRARKHMSGYGPAAFGTPGQKVHAMDHQAPQQPIYTQTKQKATTIVPIY
ncbi:hypothetical protein DBR32_12270 [Taibaiella sp. KBW10]|uniref:hypothetical protein n=1 Tax=Taibaiella sp. KBW10 TaxID=2153357 RepID=UPI000F59BDE2|nr:hypothetical protein [Taibaiella sp. KBW10]RQO30339.1 hypothetical protein DBR32_12270 [Taibaiella sp. KBW10]